MSLGLLTNFFMWCSIINGTILTLWAILFMAAPDLVYRIQSKWFPLKKEEFNIVYYGFLGLFKILFIMFNIVPYIALRIIA